MKMIVHEHEGVQREAEPVHGLGQQLAEMPPVTVIEIDGAAFIAPGSDMIPRAGPFDANGASHAAICKNKAVCASN
jgi:hypothetical protein